ncbi:hypothetical protein [Humibacillus xanthopallidus]|uniref:hypothetical protein n=1 Tax=Humibacillus xanthopallidus TaxID=412689 RepID=UPI002892BBB7|nr:hypothetical protein [Humibacillus xanthopallidus]
MLSPFGGRSRMPAGWGMDLATQVDELRTAGSRVQTVFPDVGAGDVFDANALDPSTRPQAARGGYEQGRALAGQLADFWADPRRPPSAQTSTLPARNAAQRPSGPAARLSGG